jgi:hypothetical protein
MLCDDKQLTCMLAGTYNSLFRADTSTPCDTCPDNTSTEDTGASSAADCTREQQIGAQCYCGIQSLHLAALATCLHLLPLHLLLWVRQPLGSSWHCYVLIALSVFVQRCISGITSRSILELCL